MLQLSLVAVSYKHYLWKQFPFQAEKSLHKKHWTGWIVFGNRISKRIHQANLRIMCFHPICVLEVLFYGYWTWHPGNCGARAGLWSHLSSTLRCCGCCVARRCYPVGWSHADELSSTTQRRHAAVGTTGNMPGIQILRWRMGWSIELVPPNILF